MNHKKLLALTESAVMLALAFVLNLVVIWQAPLGGKVTLVSMLPVMLVGLRHGVKWGFATTCAYAVLQTALSFAKVLGWGLTPAIFIICILFDYFLPYALLGIPSFFRRGGKVSVLIGIGLALVARFACHFITGVTIWANWAEDAPGAIFSYSLLYNGQYMLPELVFTIIAAVVLMNVPHAKKLFAPVD
ncbi:MAG: energy-coupled thiamine transporter ThiT [Oscillospiraceae bacterium]|nr:energy-coupled thiamine transporter ThiT [Oscillospiraceae bacterium]